VLTRTMKKVEKAAGGLDDDPIVAVLKVKVPMLFLYGGADPWVPVAKSVERLQSLKSQGHKIE
jgi:pimeloyl-ACP methyl ester carboxylesterase